MSQCRSIREFESILESTFEQLEQLHSTPLEIADNFLMEEVAEFVSEVSSQATYFNCPIVVPVRSMRTPLEGMRIVGRLLAWVREEMLRESPFLNVSQAMRYVGATSKDQIYRAVEVRRLEPMKCGKESRFTTEMLERSMQR